MCLPHFIMGPYEYDKSFASFSNNITDICQPKRPTISLSDEQCMTNINKQDSNVLSLLFMGQILLGIGGVPIQPFGISYIDDFASKRNSPLYIGILFAVTLMGPGLGFILGSAMLRYYVDIDKIPSDEIVLTLKDPRWIGAWWLGFIVASSLAAIAAIPYFFFPKEMPKEDADEKQVESKPSLLNEFKDNLAPKETLSLSKFIKVFPHVLLRTLKSPIFMLVVLAQSCMSAMVCGLATFMAKFLERQFSVTASFANLLIGSVNIPGAMAGIVVGGIIMKKFHLTPKQCGALCVMGLTLCVAVAFPLLFLGCSTQKFASPQNDYHGSSGIWQNVTNCSNKCSCSETAFNPICGSDGTEYISPCFAGCEQVNFDQKDNNVQNYTRCSCIHSPGSESSATPGSCGTGCYNLFLPFVILSCLAGTLASISQTPSFMLILRNVQPSDKSLAIGIQFMLLRILAWLPGPVMFGSVIDSTCVLWGKKCGKKAACQYYDNNLFRQRFIGLQLLFKVGAFIFFLATFFVLRYKEKKNVGQQEIENIQEIHKLTEKSPGC
ncbi:solute carrier organic anion transporter family member 2B1 isoform X2 [Bombina bombina]|nr:solute carrier organic anion transporter family member 2B1 isoform X2 [Bombina bombina]XP_053564741.1 solute carrier organic anion transporter family member 2B1 isoform X2 [Bombina bombina]